MAEKNAVRIFTDVYKPVPIHKYPGCLTSFERTYGKNYIEVRYYVGATNRDLSGNIDFPDRISFGIHFLGNHGRCLDQELIVHKLMMSMAAIILDAFF